MPVIPLGEEEKPPEGYVAIQCGGRSYAVPWREYWADLIVDRKRPACTEVQKIIESLVDMARWHSGTVRQIVGAFLLEARKRGLKLVDTRQTDIFTDRSD